MLTDHVPETLARRERVWSRLLEQHHQGAHHPLLCASPRACESYERVLIAQNGLVVAALKLPPAEREYVAQELQKPGISDFSALIDEICRYQPGALARGTES